MRRINLLRHKSSHHHWWNSQNYEYLQLPEVILEGSHVIHTDEDGYILGDEQSDQHLRTKHRDKQRLMQVMMALAKDGATDEMLEEAADILRDLDENYTL